MRLSLAWKLWKWPRKGGCAPGNFWYNLGMKNIYYVWVYTVFGWQRYVAVSRKAAEREVRESTAKAYAYDTAGTLDVKNY